MIYLQVASLKTFEKIKKWSNGDFSSWVNNDIEVEGLITFMTPDPWNIIIGFCDSKKMRQRTEITPLLLLKNVIPSYYLKQDLKPGIMTNNLWDEIGYLVLFHNPGLRLTLNNFENEYL